MATPHVAGIMALLKQLHPDWTVEELKALAMNGALHDLTIGGSGSGFAYGTARIGAGRVDPSNSAQSAITAFNADDPGVVSLSFDVPLLGNGPGATKNVRVVNHGSTDVTYNLGVDQLVSNPGISFSFPNGGSITVPAGKSIEFPVQMSWNASQMTFNHDPTMAPTQAAASPLQTLGNVPRQFLPESSGYVTFSTGSNVNLRVPLYMGGRPASSMFGPDTITTGGGPTGSTTIPLSGSAVCSGTLGAGPVCNGTFPLTEVSLVTPFELQAVNPRNPAVPAYADVQYAGVAFNPTTGQLLFGISTWGPWSTPRDVAFNIVIDPTNTGQFTRVLFNSDPGTMDLNLFGTAGADSQDSFIVGAFNTATSGVSVPGAFINLASGSSLDTGAFKNRVIVLAATPASLGITGPSFHWKIQTLSGAGVLAAIAAPFETVGPTQGFAWNRSAQGLNFSGSNLSQDLNGASIPVTWNTANMTANGSLGALLLHTHNVDGTQAQVIPLDSATFADLGITVNASGNPPVGQNVTLILTVTNTNGAAATSVAVTDVLPAGLTYVSDDGGGAYNSSSGVWTISALGTSASATLHIIATVETSDPITDLAQVMANAPLDPNPTNNQASVVITPEQEADLALVTTPTLTSVAQGSDIIYSLVVTNNGGDPAYNLQLNESFPGFPSLPIKSFTTTAGVFNSGAGVWNVASLGNGMSETLSITVTAPNTCGPLTNNSSVSSDQTDPNSNNNNSTASPTITGPPSITTNPVTQAICPGANVTFTAAATSSPSPTVQWQVSTNGGATFVNITGATSTTLTFVAGAAMNGNQYRAVFTSACGSINTTAATLNLNSAPTVTSNPVSQSIAGSGTITFSAAASGTPAPTVQWQVSTNGGASFTNIPGATSTTLTLTSSPSLDGNQYRAVFTNACGSATTTAASAITFDLCMQDNTTKNILQINTKTGDYNFIICSTGSTLSGKGSVSTVNNTVTLTDKKSDRTITASFNEGSLTGTAVITLMPAPGISQTYRINDTQSRGKGCSCTMP